MSRTIVPRYFQAARHSLITQGAGSSLRLALYQDNGNGYPGALVTNTDSNISGAAAGTILATFGSPASLLPGVYWQASNSTTATCSCRAHSSAAIASILGAAIGAGAIQATAWSVAGMYLALRQVHTRLVAASSTQGCSHMGCTEWLRDRSFLVSLSRLV